MWTREALHKTAAGLLAGRKFIVLANREPYMHLRDGDDVRWIEPASGVTSALEMPAEEQEQRMFALRGRVRERNVFTWVAEILEEAKERLRSQVMQEVS